MTFDESDLLIILLQILWQIFDLQDLIITTIPGLSPV
jgi:hypothetical protein